MTMNLCMYKCMLKPFNMLSKLTVLTFNMLLNANMKIKTNNLRNLNKMKWGYYLFQNDKTT